MPGQPQSTSKQTTENRILAALSPEEFELYFSDMQPVNLTIRAVIVEPGGRLDAVYFIDSGIASILTTLDDGGTVEVGMIGSEGVIGLSGLLGAETSVQQIIIQISGHARRLNMVAARRAFLNNATLRDGVYAFLENFLNLSAQTAGCNRVHSIEQRFARWLLMATDRVQSDVIPMTHEFIASMLGVRRVGVTQVATQLQRLGLISYRRGILTITDRPGLERTACECYLIDRTQLTKLRSKS